MTAWDAGTRRAALAHEAGLAEEHAAVAKRRIPELEAEKKAAAAARVSPPGLHVSQVQTAQGAAAGCSSHQGKLSLQPQQLIRMPAVLEAGNKTAAAAGGSLAGALQAA